jgi:hypothetical protein
MDEPLDTDFKLHIFCGSRAAWDKESADVVYYDEAPEYPNDGSWPNYW